MKHGIGPGNNRFPGVILKMSHKSLYIFIFLILVSSVIATDLISKDDGLISKDDGLKEDYEFKTSIDSQAITVKEYSEREYTSLDKSTVKYIDTKLESARTKVELVNVKITDKQPEIKITRDDFFETDIIFIDQIELDNGIIIQEKYNHDSNITDILHTQDGLNFTRASIPFFQNNTHVWYNVTGFSGFTSTTRPTWFFLDYGMSGFWETWDLTDYHTGHDTVEWDMFDPFTNDYVITTNNNDYVYKTTLGNNLLYVYVSPSGDLLSIGKYAQYFDDDDIVIRYIRPTETNLFFSVHGRVGDHPDMCALGVQSPATTSSSVDIKPCFNRNDYFNDVPIQYRIRYKKSTQGWLDAQSTSWFSYTIASDLETTTRKISGLDSGTTYNFEVDMRWRESIEDAYNEISGTDTVTETTDSEPVPAPSVDTLPATNTVGDGTTATISGISDFDGYTGTVTGKLCLSDVGETDCTNVICAFTCTSQSITDDTIFTSDLTGLTVDTQRWYYARIEGDFGTSVNGNILSFTPTVPAETGLLTGLISYYKLDEITGVVKDSHGTNDGTNYGATRGVTGKLNNAYDFDGTDDYIDTNLNFLGTQTVSFWVKFDTLGYSTDAVFGIRDTTNNYRFYMWLENGEFVGNTPAWVFVTSTGATGSSIQRTYINQDIQTGVWYHVVMTYDSANGDKQLFIDAGTPATGTQSGVNPSGLSYYFGDINGADSPIGLYADIQVDEVAFYDRILSSDEISELNNDGNALAYDFTTETTPTTTTLAVQDITEDTATLRQIPDFGDYTGDVWGIYQIIKVEDAIGDPSTWEWTVYPSGFLAGTADPFTLTDNTIHSIGVTNLRFNTQYYVQGVAVWDYDVNTGLYNEYFYSEEVEFTTNNPTLPTIDVLTPLQVSFNSAVARGRVLTLGSFDTVDFSLFFEDSNILSVTTSDFGMVNGIQGQTVTGLTENTTYCYDARVQVSWTDDTGFNAETQQTEQMCFNTTFEGDPSINTLPATNIKRAEAQLNFEIFDLGMYESIPIYFEYWNEGNESNSITTDSIPYFEIVSGGVKVENLMMNTTYYYKVLTEINGREISGGTLDFKTLSLDDFLAPTLELSVADIGMESIDVNAFLDLNDAENVDLYFYLFDASETLINTTLYMDANETRMWNSLFEGLESQTRYYYQAEAFYYDTDTNTSESVLTFRDTAVTLNVYETSTTVCIIDRLCLDIQDRYLFMMLFIVGMSIIGLGFSVGSSFSQFAGAERLLSYGITFFVIISAIWLNAVQVMPTWIFIYIAVGSVLIFVFYVLRGVTGGSVYG